MQILETAFDSQLMKEALDLRTAVFVREQNVPPELEFDEEDPVAVHLVAVDRGEVVGTLRITSEGAVSRIGRVAVRRSERGRGIGSRLVRHATDLLEGSGTREIILHAQIQTIPFYRRLGYREEGEIDYDAGIAHLWMRKHAPASPAG